MVTAALIRLLRAHGFMSGTFHDQWDSQMASKVMTVPSVQIGFYDFNQLCSLQLHHNHHHDSSPARLIVACNMFWSPCRTFTLGAIRASKSVFS